ncbi:class I SAM-dependent methyltransferase [Cellulosilyticum sp. ST5]|uniref:class I SAM-dependent methyltransferase n=1 Tax=Cellulosilyticum sp. ST5 TaxID=3055805 RepID=UPI003977AECA
MSCYYNEHAQEFLAGTVNLDMQMHYEPFLKLVPEGGVILDAGCGSGRDSLAFKKLGYYVVAMDACAEMCQFAGEYIGQSVYYCRFQDMDFKLNFDGIWASASLLHVPSEELPAVLRRCAYHLKPNGVLYASFKYGDFEGERNGRHFLDLKEERAEGFFIEAGFKIEEMHVSNDIRPERTNEKWLNILARKI